MRYTTRLTAILAPLCLLGAMPGGLSAAEAPQSFDASSMRIRPGITRSIAPHVHVIPAQGRKAVPNVGIVVGTRSVLVIESGLGEAGGQVILDEVRKIAGEKQIYVIATHFHPEHIGGENAFPRSTIVLRPKVQEREIGESGARMIEAFRAMSPDNAALLKDFSFRAADIHFNRTLSLNLGGVHVDIMAAGPAHTDGDIAVLVREDGVLFTGDVVQQNYAPVLMGTQSSIASWLTQIEKLEALPAEIIVPSHSAITDRRAFEDMRAMLAFVRDRWAAIKAQKLGGRKAEDRLIADFKARFPECGNTDFLRMSIPKL